MSSQPKMSANEMKDAADALPFYRLRFADGYVFRTKASDTQELTKLAAEHYWWGEEKPNVEDIRLTIRSRRSIIFYVCEANGYPKNINTTDDF
jgi:hypothetical protein